MKLIFLDVDGVLNNNKAYKTMNIPVCNRLVKLVKQIVDETDAKIVLSSSWRILDPDMEGKDKWCKFLYDELAAEGLTLIGRTPIVTGGYRGTEIGKYLFSCKENIESFVILDDDADMNPFKEFFVQTNFLHGIREKNVKRAIRILNNVKFDKSVYEKDLNPDNVVVGFKKMKKENI